MIPNLTENQDVIEFYQIISSEINFSRDVSECDFFKERVTQGLDVSPP